MRRQRFTFLFWHKILLLLTASIVMLTVGLGLATWRTLGEATQEMTGETGAIFSSQTETFIQKLVQSQAATLDVQLENVRASAGYGAFHMAENLGHHSLDEIPIQEVMVRLHRNVRHCVAVYYIGMDGRSKVYPPPDSGTTPPDGHGMLLQPFFPSLSGFKEKGGRPRWSDVHVNPFSRTFDLVVDAVAPVAGEGGLRGVFGVSVSITRMIARFNQQQPLRGAYTFLMDTRRRLIGGAPLARIDLAPDPSALERGVMNLSAARGTDLNRILSRMVLGGSAIGTAILNGEPKYIAYHALRAADWRLGLVVSVRMATSPVLRMVSVVERGTRQALARMLLWALGLLVISMAGGVLLSRQITAPIRELCRAAAEIAGGNFSRRVELDTGDEMAELGTAFNGMTDRVETMVVDLNRVNRELDEQNRALAAEVAERRRAEAALRKSEERFRSLTENSPDIIFTLDTSRRFDYLNPAFEEVLGYDREEALGRTFDPFVKAEDAPVLDRAFREIQETGGTFRDLTATLPHREGTERIFNISAGPNVLTGGEVSGIVGICKDLTEHRRLETQLNQALKMEAVGTLAGGIAHDFNNLLTGVMGNVSLMMLDTEEDHPHHRKLSNIEKYVKSGADLTRQLLGFARGGSYEVKPTDINELIDATAEMFGRTRKEIRIHRLFAEEVHTVEVDRGQMEQVLLNVFVNAWHAMPGGGDLFLQTGNVALSSEYTDPHGAPPGPYVRISVTDTGVGMDKSVQQKIFEPFFTTREMGRGTGLGLASAYGIIKNHRGIITVYSEEGKGSTFNIYLPVSPRSVTAESPSPERLTRGQATLLLVDDEEMILDVGRQMLTALGYEILTASDGKTALDLYTEQQNRIDLVILDMVMPEMGGGELFDRLRTIDPEVRVVLASGYSINGQAVKILQRGCSGFIQKPFTIHDLSEKVGIALEDRRDPDAGTNGSAR